MFMNIDSSYKDLFCCFCLIFTTAFQIFWVPASTIDQSFLVGEPQGRGSLTWYTKTQPISWHVSVSSQALSSRQLDLVQRRSALPLGELVPATMCKGWGLSGTHELQQPQAEEAHRPSLRSRLDVEKSQSCSCCSVELGQAASLPVPQDSHLQKWGLQSGYNHWKNFESCWRESAQGQS